MPTPRAVRLAPFLLLAVAPGSVRAAAPPPPPSLSATEVNLVQLPLPDSEDVRLRIVVYSGSAEDPAGKEGLAFMTAAAVARRAGPAVAFQTGKDVTVFTSSGSRDSMTSRIRDLSRALIRPQIDAADLAAIRQEQGRVLDSLRADPSRLRREALDQILYRGHPYGHPAEGLDSAAATIAREEILSFHADHYVKGNLAVGLAGRLDPDLPDSVKRELAPLGDGAPSRPARPVTWLSRPRILLVEAVATPMTWIASGHPLNLSRAHPDYVPFLTALGWHREPREGSLPRRRETLLMLQEGSTAEAPGLLFGAWSGLPVSPAPRADASRVDESKRAVAEGWAEALRGPAGALDSLLDDYLYRSTGFDARFAASLEAVSGPAALGALQRHLHADRIGIAVVTPDAAALARRLVGAGGETPPKAAAHGGIHEEDIEIARAGELFR